jgi:hypothetical protein
MKPAKLSLEHKIPMADSIILAAGLLYQATVSNSSEKRFDMGGIAKPVHLTPKPESYR